MHKYTHIANKLFDNNLKVKSKGNQLFYGFIKDLLKRNKYNSSIESSRKVYRIFWQSKWLKWENVKV